MVLGPLPRVTGHSHLVSWLLAVTAATLWCSSTSALISASLISVTCLPLVSLPSKAAARGLAFSFSFLCRVAFSSFNCMQTWLCLLLLPLIYLAVLGNVLQNNYWYLGLLDLQIMRQPGAGFVLLQDLFPQTSAAVSLA